MTPLAEVKSFPFPVWSGIFEHRTKIGSAIWTFLWLIDRTTEERGDRGIVLGGSIVTAGMVARDLHFTRCTALRDLRRLREHGYIGKQRKAYGWSLWVENSKKFIVFSGKRGWQKCSPAVSKNARTVSKNARTVSKNAHSYKEDNSFSRHKEQISANALEKQPEQTPTLQTVDPYTQLGIVTPNNRAKAVGA